MAFLRHSSAQPPVQAAVLQFLSLPPLGSLKARLFASSKQHGYELDTKNRGKCASRLAWVIKILNIPQYHAATDKLASNNAGDG